MSRALPLELWTNICRRLDTRSIVCLGGTCRYMHCVVQQSAIWAPRAAKLLRKNKIPHEPKVLKGLSTQASMDIVLRPFRFEHKMYQPGPMSPSIPLILGDGDYISDLYMVPGGRFIITSHGSGFLKCWDTHFPLQTKPRYTYSAQYAFGQMRIQAQDGGRGAVIVVLGSKFTYLDVVYLRFFPDTTGVEGFRRISHWHNHSYKIKKFDLAADYIALLRDNGHIILWDWTNNTWAELKDTIYRWPIKMHDCNDLDLVFLPPHILIIDPDSGNVRSYVMPTLDTDLYSREANQFGPRMLLVQGVHASNVGEFRTMDRSDRWLNDSFAYRTGSYNPQDLPIWIQTRPAGMTVELNDMGIVTGVTMRSEDHAYWRPVLLRENFESTIIATKLGEHLTDLPDGTPIPVSKSGKIIAPLGDPKAGAMMAMWITPKSLWAHVSELSCCPCPWAVHQVPKSGQRFKQMYGPVESEWEIWGTTPSFCAVSGRGCYATSNGTIALIDWARCPTD